MNVRKVLSPQLTSVIWLLAAAIMVWVNLSQAPTDFRNARSLSEFDADEQAMILRAADRIGLTMTMMATYWLITSLVILILALVLGWMVIRRGEPRGFSFYLAMVMLASTYMVYPPSIPELLGDRPVIAFIARISTAVGATGLVIVLPLVFPDGRFVPRWTVLLVIVTLIQTGSFFFLGRDLLPAPPVIEAVTTTATILVIGGSVAYRYFRVATPDQRQQTRWVFFGFLIGIPCFFVADAMMRNIDDSVRGTFFLVAYPILVQIGFAGPVMMIVLSVLYHRLFNIDVVLGRTTVWMVMSAVVIGGYFAVVVGIGALVGTGPNLVLSVFATGIVALLFQPVRLRVQRVIDRWIYGARDDPYEVISSIGQHLAQGTGVADVLPNLVQVIGEMLKLPYVALYLENISLDQPVAIHGHSGEVDRRFAVAWQGSRQGWLDVAARSRGEHLNSAETNLLTDLATQLGLVVYTVKLAEELQVSREQIVRSREDERRRLRRDLHDTVGAQLAALSMQTSVIRNRIATEPEVATDQLDLLRTELKSTIESVRRLVEGLRPPMLDELGLEGAVRNRLERLQHGSLFQHLEVDVPQPLPPLPAALEVAAYRIVEEATTNAVRHADATLLGVSLAMEPTRLIVTIRDDGKGIQTTNPAGLGLQSMHDRAAELGGTVEIGEGADGVGTVVRAVLPVEMVR